MDSEHTTERRILTASFQTIRDVYNAEVDDPQVYFPYNLLDWLDEWKNRTAQYDSGKLIKETHAALHQTTHGLVEIARYCLTELNMLYVLFGKIQTDSLEDRFGKYRQLAGSQYHVSIRQIYKVENKMRLQSTLPTVNKPSEHESHRDEQWEDLDRDEGAARANYNVVVTQDTLSKMTVIIPLLVYVEGCSVYSTLRRLKYEKCRDILTIDKEVTVSVEDPNYDLVKELDRGGLVHSSIFAVNAVAHSYAVVEELSRREDFLTIPNQRQVATDLTVELYSLMMTHLISMAVMLDTHEGDCF
ncbi:hypothetical protein HPB48_020581 [Haemaphysalis longicornis]|uniref:Uncharacterized protein n=1 Tax=Haemaphysalis longicornis TaxID=44386 RepID=A0A9J6FR13_HAELO|nr:hypothetical protein HPB48_020581 [Haemaphysalis longicornis]